MKTPRQKIITKLDDVVRQILRKKYPEICVVCGKKTGWYHPKENTGGLQVGHFVSRRFYALRWDLRNVHPQCSSCNFLHNNNPIPYTQFMLDYHGSHVIDELEAKRRHIAKYSIVTLHDLYDELLEVYNAL